ncbi:hypothetical protein QE152_g4310 [Popillia japonica]|uniref:MHD domain-containing protein n=1 Tax=Popillia japonica TaxID=7064 RepID=A0AAW1MZJ0_POPJA
MWEMPRWNFRKADWNKFRHEVDSAIQIVPALTKSYQQFVNILNQAARNSIPRGFQKEYQQFVNILNQAARNSIPRGFQKEYVPCWSKETQKLYEQYEQTGEGNLADEIITEETQKLYEQYEQTGEGNLADEIITALDAARAEIWRETTAGLNFTHCSRRTWSVLRKLGAATPPPQSTITIDPNDIAERLQKIPNKFAEQKIGTYVELNMKLGFVFLNTQLITLYYIGLINSYLLMPVSVKLIGITNCPTKEKLPISTAFEIMTREGNRQSIYGNASIDLIIDKRIVMTVLRMKMSKDDGWIVDKIYMRASSFCKILDNYLRRTTETAPGTHLESFCPMHRGSYQFYDFTPDFKGIQFPVEMLGYVKLRIPVEMLGYVKLRIELECLRVDGYSKGQREVVACNEIELVSSPPEEEHTRQI